MQKRQQIFGKENRLKRPGMVTLNLSVESKLLLQKFSKQGNASKFVDHLIKSTLRKQLTVSEAIAIKKKMASIVSEYLSQQADEILDYRNSKLKKIHEEINELYEKKRTEEGL